jgi:hypothetical protein
MGIRKEKGLGDSIERLVKAFKMDKVAHKIAKVTGKEDCGCSQRKEYLNNKFPYNK